MGHRHEWRTKYDEQLGWYAYCTNPECMEKLLPREIERRLNATEALSAEDALVELEEAAHNWLWHQDKYGSPWYTSAPSEQIAKEELGKD